MGKNPVGLLSGFEGALHSGSVPAKPWKRSSLEPQPVLRNLGRLVRLTNAGRKHLLEMMSSPVKVKARRKLLDHGHPSAHMYVVLSGWVSEYRQLRDGTRQILDFRLPGEITGTECLLYNNALYSAVTVTESTIASVSRDMFEAAQREFPRLASAFLLSRIASMACLQERTVLIGRRPAFSRIAHLLMELDWRLQRCGLVPNGRIPFPLKQQDIADCTGLTSPYVNRVIKEMRGRKLIFLEDNFLEIRDPAELARHAGFNNNYLAPFGQTFDADGLLIAISTHGAAFAANGPRHGVRMQCD